MNTSVNTSRSITPKDEPLLVETVLLAIAEETNISDNLIDLAIDKAAEKRSLRYPKQSVRRSLRLEVREKLSRKE